MTSAVAGCKPWWRDAPHRSFGGGWLGGRRGRKSAPVNGWLGGFGRRDAAQRRRVGHAVNCATYR
jgi:hypothetical protein